VRDAFAWRNHGSRTDEPIDAWRVPLFATIRRSHPRYFVARWFRCCHTDRRYACRHPADRRQRSRRSRLRVHLRLARLPEHRYGRGRGRARTADAQRALRRARRTSHE